MYINTKYERSVKIKKIFCHFIIIIRILQTKKYILSYKFTLRLQILKYWDRNFDMHDESLNNKLHFPDTSMSKRRNCRQLFCKALKMSKDLILLINGFYLIIIRCRNSREIYTRNCNKIILFVSSHIAGKTNNIYWQVGTLFFTF